MRLVAAMRRRAARALSAAIGPSSSSMPFVSFAMVWALTAPDDLGDVGLRDAERRVREHVGEVAVVGEHEQAGGLGIESTDVEESLVVVAGELAQVGATALVCHRADDADGLVEHDVALGGVELDGGAVDRRRGRSAALGGRVRSTISPLTVTRPCAIRSSETRREATPAAAMTFCSRSPSGRASRRVRYQAASSKPVGSVVEQRRDVRQLVDRVDAELRQQHVGGLVVDRAGLAVGEGLGDEAAAEQGAHDRVDVDGANRRDRRRG